MIAIKHLVRNFVPARLLLRRQALLQYRRWEPELALLQLVCDRSAVAVDVGANLGVYTYFAAKYSARVYSLEPVPDVVSRLRASVPSNVTVLPVAASDKAGKSTLYVPRLGRVAVDTRATLETTANPGFDADPIEIETQRIDDLGLENVAFMKIDVEGHEQAVLRGARDLIASSRPTVLIESEERHAKGTVASTKAFFDELGYGGFFLHSGRLQPMAFFDPARHQRPEDIKGLGKERKTAYINNFLFIHASRQDIRSKVENKFPPEERW
jgi:FkbM family methyltransferase